MTTRSLMLPAVLAAVLVPPLGLAASPAAAAPCETQVNQALQDLAVPRSDVKSVKVVKRSAGAKSASNYRLDAWVELASCSSGHLVIDMTRYCLVQDSYTTGNCQVGNLPRY